MVDNRSVWGDLDMGESDGKNDGEGESGRNSVDNGDCAGNEKDGGDEVCVMWWFDRDVTLDAGSGVSG